MSDKFELNIKTPNRMIFVHGKLSRTPLKTVVTKEVLEALKVKMAAEGILNFSIKEYSPPKPAEPKPIEKPVVEKKTAVKKKTAPKSTLEKLSSEE